MSLATFFEIEEAITTYVCNGCKLDLPVVEYGFDSGGNKRRSHCRACDKKYARQSKELRKTIFPPPEDHECPICNRTSAEIIGDAKGKIRTSTSAWSLDHDHETGKFRGWICNKCNLALGNFNDDIIRIRNAVTYLEAHYG